MATKPTWTGQTLGDRYKIGEPLGQGGMSAVYKGTDPNLRRTVAIKLIHSHLAEDPQFVRRFEEEAAAVAQLRHSNIIQVYDFNHDDDVYYMILEYLEGETLGERQTGLAQEYKRLSIQDTVLLMIKLTDAVHYAHEQGMIHRDLKPANVMLREDNDPVLMDFGIVKMVQNAGHTATGVIMGTMAYMAPEQIRGENVDHRIDIYALGVILFEVLSGRKPFDGESTVTTMMKHLNEPPPDLSSLDPEIPYNLAEVVYKAMEKDPGQRYQSAAAMNAALRQAGAAMGIVSATDAITLTNASPISSDATEIYQADLTSFAQKSPQTVQHRPLIEQTKAHENTTDGSEEGQSSYKQTTVWFGVAAVVILLLLIFTAFRQGQQRIVSVQATAEAQATLLAEQSLLATESAVSAEETRLAVELVATESAQATAEANPANLDDDGDGLNNAEEAELGTDPNDPDSDRDGLTDLNEKAVACLNPLSPDTDNDGVLDSADETPCEAAVLAPDVAARITNIEVAEFEVIPSSSGSSYDEGYGYEGGSELEEQEVETPVAEETVVTTEQRYVITFEADGFEPSPRNTHVHFYYNTVAADDSGLPGAGPWEIHVNSDPFTRFKVSETPEGATEICIIAANGDHTFIPGTDACVPIPTETAALKPKQTARTNNIWSQTPESFALICEFAES